MINILSIKTDHDANDIKILCKEFDVSRKNIFTFSLFKIDYLKSQFTCNDNQTAIFTSVNAVKSLIHHNISIPNNSITVGKKSSNLILLRKPDAKTSSYNCINDLVYNLEKDKKYIYFRGENVKMDLSAPNIQSDIVYVAKSLNNANKLQDILDKNHISSIVLYSQRSIDEFLKLNIGNNILYYIPYSCKTVALNVKYFDPNDPKFR
jgi:hypothetical protein